MKASEKRPDLMPLIGDVNSLVEKALNEDLAPLGDLTSTLIDPSLQAVGELRSRDDGVVAGCVCVEQTLKAVDERLSVEWSLVDGDKVAAGQTIGVLNGPFAAMLTAERTALNFLSHLSGIASNAAQWVEIADGRVTVWDTRKTLPGYRSLQKAAVRAGGAVNHRGNLSDWLMIKDNHLLGTTMAAAVASAKAQWPGRAIHAEADSEAIMIQALECGVDIILLDNFSPNDLGPLVANAKAWAANNSARMPLLEASGGITLETLDAYAGTGVDLVSSGSLTNSAPPLDIGLDVKS